jgi:hypothetical protein
LQKDFPTIQEEILAGASDVESSAKQLNEATIVLAKGTVEDRPGAWDALGEAVRIMAQNTAILLHIVYVSSHFVCIFFFLKNAFSQLRG